MPAPNHDSNQDANQQGQHDPKPQWNPHAAVAGWILPGLGHWILGMRVRGVVLCVAISTLWLGGMLIGGISVMDKVDRAEPTSGDNPPLRSTGTSMWFFGQALIAPSIVIDRMRASTYLDFAKEKYADADYPDAYKDALEKHANYVLVPDGKHEPPFEPSVARVAEQGVLFTALAGLLNLLAMIDVLYCDPQYRRDRDEGKPAKSEHVSDSPSASAPSSAQELA